jgi:hypothetical protein
MWQNAKHITITITLFMCKTYFKHAGTIGASFPDTVSPLTTAPDFSPVRRAPLCPVLRQRARKGLLIDNSKCVSRPVFAQFCANDPKTLLAAARHVEADCDYVDLNLGCPKHVFLTHPMSLI